MAGKRHPPPLLPPYDGNGAMTTAIAIYGNMASTFLNHFFGSGLSDDVSNVSSKRSGHGEKRLGVIADGRSRWLLPRPITTEQLWRRPGEMEPPSK